MCPTRYPGYDSLDYKLDLIKNRIRDSDSIKHESNEDVAAYANENTNNSIEDGVLSVRNLTGISGGTITGDTNAVNANGMTKGKVN